MDNFLDELLKILLSLLLGSLLGLEREYRCRPAGFRTIALICVGSTVYTILSHTMGNAQSQDRIAANIVTGIGFIGAGVIFKHGYNVYGLTTAATIWVAAAIGMCVGHGDFPLAWTVLIITLTILSIFEYMQEQVDVLHQKRNYIVLIEGITYDSIIEQQLSNQNLRYTKLKEKRKGNFTTCEYEVYGKQKNLDLFNEFLLDNDKIIEFEY